MKYLKQSTAAVIPFGPALLPADGVTLVTSLVTALDHASTGIFLCKNGGAAAIRHASVTATTYDSYGSYLVTLDTTDTNTLGRLRVIFAAAASTLPIWEDFTVLPANMFDSLISGSDLFDVSVTQLLGTAWLTPGTAGTPDVNAKLHGGTSQTGRDIGLSVLLSSGTGTGQVSLTSGAVTNVLNLVNAPSDSSGTTTLLSRIASAITITSNKVDINDKTGFSLSSAGVQAIWDALTSALTTVGSIGKLLVTNIDALISSRGTSTYSGGAVASVTAGVTVSTNNDKTGYSISGTKTTLDALNDITTANVLTQVNSALNAGGSELSAIPTTTGSIIQKLNFLFEYFRNKKTITATTETLLKEDASTTLGTSTVSDDGTTFVKGEMN